MNDSDATFTQWLEQNADLIVSFISGFPLLFLLIVLVPFVAAAVVRRAYPSSILVALFGVTALASLLVLIEPSGVMYAVVGWIDVAFVLIAIVDLLMLPSQKRFACSREVLKIASIGKPHGVVLHVDNLSKSKWEIKVKDDFHDSFSMDREEFLLTIPAHKRGTIEYSFTSNQRGKFPLRHIYLKIRSRLKLWDAYFRRPAENDIHVYPDMKQLAEFAILSRTNRLSLMGVRRMRRVGQDNEFERLRDYNQDDNYKFIEWRATARRNRLTVKDFQVNQSQRIIFMVDCGRMMTNLAGEMTLLDHSINAALMMSYVALRQGDSVGMICFSDHIHSFTPPRGGLNQMNQLLHATFDRHPQLVESRYDEAFLYLKTHCAKRAMVVLITNIIDEINANQVHEYLSNLTGRHLPLGVLLRDRRIYEYAESYEADPQNLYRAAAASDILSWRNEVLTDMVHQGVLALDVFPEQLAPGLVNQYLEIKARHLL
jgi:uncharacterized protein (DUF58 family)